MLNSAEHELLNAHNYENIKEYGIFHLDKPRMLFFLLINDKMPTKNCWHFNIYGQEKIHAQLS